MTFLSEHGVMSLLTLCFHMNVTNVTEFWGRQGKAFVKEAFELTWALLKFRKNFFLN